MKSDKLFRAIGQIGDEKIIEADTKMLTVKPVKSKRFKWAPAAVAASLVLLMSVLAFPQVRAAIGQLFTFIPGIGILEKNESTVYTIRPIVGQSKTENAKATIDRALYSDGYLSLIVSVDGKAVHYDAFSVYLNQNPIDYRSDSCTLSTSSDSSMLYFSYKTTAPADSDVYEIEVTGFPERLSFQLAPCNDYNDIAEIGPTDTQNGISITTTADIIDDKLVVWCYPFYDANTIKDRIIGYGNAVNAAWIKEKYIETNGDILYENASGWGLTGRIVFDKPDDTGNAVLHIPYLSMLRNEEKKTSINLPKDYTTEDCDIPIECSLGTARITEIKREPNAYDSDKDTVWIKFDFGSNDSSRVFNSFDYQTTGDSSNAMHFDEQTGCLEYIEAYVEKDMNKITLTISDLYYYLLGEYVIPLEIAR